MFWDQETVAWTLTDDTGASALESLRHPRTVHQVAVKLAMQTGYSVSDVRPEVARLIDSAVRCGVVEADREPRRALNPSRPTVLPTLRFSISTSPQGAISGVLTAMRPLGPTRSAKDVTFSLS